MRKELERPAGRERCSAVPKQAKYSSSWWARQCFAVVQFVIQFLGVSAQKQGREMLVGAGPRACPAGGPPTLRSGERAGTGTCPYDCSPFLNSYGRINRAHPQTPGREEDPPKPLGYRSEFA